jgi:hypothetical protein
MSDICAATPPAQAAAPSGKGAPSNARLPQARIQEILQGLLAQLSSLHRANAIHGGICLSMLVSDAGQPMRLPPADKAGASPGPWQTGYAPFEQYSDDPAWPTGPWTDIYALSALAYDLIHGHPPPSAMERCVRDTLESHETLAERLPEYAPDFLAAIDRGLRFDWRERHADLPEFALALGVSAPAPAQPKRSAVTPVQPARASKWIWKTAALAGCAAIAALLAIFSGSPPPLDATPAASAPMATLAWPQTTAATPMPPPPPSAQTTASASAPAGSPAISPVISPAPEVTPPVPQVTPPAPQTAGTTVYINIRPWGEVMVDGVPRGVSPPLKTLSLSAGSHKLVVRNADLPPFETTLTIVAGKPVAISHTFE